MIEEQIVQYFRLDSTLLALLPEQTGMGATSTDRKKASIVARTAPQTYSKPFVLVSPPNNYDHDVYADSVGSLKSCNYMIGVATDQRLVDVYAIRDRLLALIDAVRSVWVPSNAAAGKVFCQSFIVLDAPTQQMQNPSGNEQGLSSAAILIQAAFYR